MNMDLDSDRRFIRSRGRSTRYVLLTFTAPETARTAKRPPLNVSFVLDRSGSMGGEKIELARAAIVQGLRMLRDDDFFSVIAYDYEVGVVVPATPAIPEAIRNAATRVQETNARGNTDLSGGWLRGCEQIAQHLADGQTARCLLISDGLANRGITNREELARHSAELRSRGIATSCLGIGADYDERLLSGIATASGGHSYHVERAVNIADVLTSELGEALETVARDVSLMVTPSAGVSVSTLNDTFPAAPAPDGSVSVQIGDLVSRQEVSVVFRLTFPSGEVNATSRVLFGITDAGGVLTEPGRDLVFTCAGDTENDAEPRNRTVDRAVAELFAAAAKSRALELNRTGRYDEAREQLERTARKIETYAGTDPELRRIVRELRERHEAYSAPMHAFYQKAEYAASLNIMRMRAPDGKARRRSSS
jgi:Ca-activated chloride channel family protein